MNKRILKTHRCDQILRHNVDYINGNKISIYYGYMYNTYNDNDSEDWWLAYVHYDMEYDTTWLDTICTIEYCPCCGCKLER